MFCGAGGCSVGYERAGFDVTGVDIAPQRHHRGGRFVQADALEFIREHGHEFDAIHASPPCQAHSVLRQLRKDKSYPDLIPATRAALVATGKPYVIENVPGAPLGGGSTWLLMLCGTMFGLQTPDGRAEIRRHRLFETNWCFGLRPECRHGDYTLTVVGHDMHSMKARNARRRAMSVTGTTPQTNVVRTIRETFSVADARAAMGIDWPMPMKHLSQAIPPAYTFWIGRRLMEHLREALDTPDPISVTCALCRKEDVG